DRAVRLAGGIGPPPSGSRACASLHLVSQSPRAGLVAVCMFPPATVPECLANAASGTLVIAGRSSHPHQRSLYSTELVSAPARSLYARRLLPSVVRRLPGFRSCVPP